jgi:SAM-dependent methyltransferase
MNDWYNEIGKGYADLRIPDSRIAKLIHAALGNIDTVANIGAGTGSYEPPIRDVLAIEPSILMLNQYKGTGKRIQGTAESIPLGTDSVDATMAILTLHHWENWRKGIAEMFRVSRNAAVLLTHKPDLDDFWLFDYFPLIRDIDRKIFSAIEELEAEANLNQWKVETITVPVPCDCTDGFLGAYWQRPRAYFSPQVRRSISTFNLLDADLTERALERLGHDLDSGAWNERYGYLNDVEELDIGYRILRMTPVRKKLNAGNT